jgi:hypothetical protein
MKPHEPKKTRTKQERRGGGTKGDKKSNKKGENAIKC